MIAEATISLHSDDELSPILMDDKIEEAIRIEPLNRSLHFSFFSHENNNNNKG